MNWYTVLQSIITWTLTGFAASCFAWAAKTSKRITKLEEHEHELRQDIAELKSTDAKSLTKLDEVINNQVKMSTKLDLLLDGKITLKKEGD